MHPAEHVLPKTLNAENWASGIVASLVHHGLPATAIRITLYPTRCDRSSALLERPTRKVHTRNPTCKSKRLPGEVGAASNFWSHPSVFFSQSALAVLTSSHLSKMRISNHFVSVEGVCMLGLCPNQTPSRQEPNLLLNPDDSSHLEPSRMLWQSPGYSRCSPYSCWHECCWAARTGNKSMLAHRGPISTTLRLLLVV